MRLAAAAMPGPSATNSLERALVLLELLARHPGGLTNADISRRLHIATSTSSYILRRLERWEYVKRDTETGTYEIGRRAVALAQGALQSLGLRQVVKPMLHSLVEQTRLTAVIAVLDHGQAMVVERVDTPEFVRVDVAVGARLPVHCTSLGKILIANLPKEQLEPDRRTRNGETDSEHHRLACAADPGARDRAPAGTPCLRKSTSSESARSRRRL